MSSILQSKYIRPTRPYSSNELNDRRKKIYRDLRIGKTKASHAKCGHFYKVRDKGRKEKDIIEQQNPDSGNCSVCWKFFKTPNYLKNSASQLIECYENKFSNDPETFDYNLIDVESSFYTWLYTE